jgi:hypothetical protein
MPNVNKVIKKAQDARSRAQKENYSSGSSAKTDELVMTATRGKKAAGLEKIIGRYPNAAEAKAANVMQQRRRTDTQRTASRAEGIAKREAQKAQEARTNRGISGGASKKVGTVKKVSVAKKNK